MYAAKCSKCGTTATTKGPGHQVFLDDQEATMIRSVMLVREKETTHGTYVNKDLEVFFTMSEVDEDPTENMRRTARYVGLMLAKWSVDPIQWARLTCQHSWVKVADEID